MEFYVTLKSYKWYEKDNGKKETLALIRKIITRSHIKSSDLPCNHFKRKRFAKFLKNLPIGS